MLEHYISKNLLLFKEIIKTNFFHFHYFIYYPLFDINGNVPDDLTDLFIEISDISLAELV